MKMKNWMRALTGAGALAACSLASWTATAVAEPAKTDTKAGAKADAKSKLEGAKDTIIFKSGKHVEGRVLEETDTSVKFLIAGPGGITAETTFAKADILTIEKADAKAADAKGADAKAAATPIPGKGTEAAKGDGEDAKGKKDDGKDKASADPNASKVYLATFKGEFGRDVSKTPLRAMMADAKKLQPDVLVFRVDCAFSAGGEERKDFTRNDAGQAYNSLETARELATIILDEVRDDPEWKTKPRVVMWVNKALGGAAWVPFLVPDLYFTTAGRMGGVGGLEHMFDNVGDKVAQEKQYSLRMKRAEGLAFRGGHEPRLIEAMSRIEYVLSVSFVGGKPEYHTDASGDLLLTDDGKEENRDTLEQIIRFEGNDVLILNAELAFRLGESKGTADTLDQLMFELGSARGYNKLDGRSDAIFKEWSKGVVDAERDISRLFREFQRLTGQGATPEERTANMGKQIRILTEAKAIIDRYHESLNPQALGGAPDQWLNEIDRIINEIKTRIRLNKPR